MTPINPGDPEPGEPSSSRPVSGAAPGSARQERPLRTVFLLLGLFVWTALTFNFGIILYDEGLAAVFATRVMKGEVVYRDFFTNYGPAHVYVMAALFKLLGPSLLLVRLYMLLTAFVLGMVVYAFGVALSGPIEAGLACLLVLTFPVGSYFYGLPALPATLFSLASVLAMHHGGWAHERRWLLAAGALAGLAALYRHDFGIALVLSEWLVLVAWSPAGGPRRWREAARGVLTHAAGLCGVVALPVALLLLAVPMKTLLYDLVVFPLTVYPEAMHLPYPDLLEPLGPVLAGRVSLVKYLVHASARFQFYLPLLMLALTALTLGFGRRFSKSEDGAPHAQTAATLFLLGGAFVLHMAGRPDFGHTLPANAVAAVLFAFLGGELRAGGKRLAVALLALVMLFATLDRAYQKVTMSRAYFSPSGLFWFSVPRAKGIARLGDGTVYENCVGYVHFRVPENESLFVASEYNDPPPIHDVMLYFLSERSCATKHDNLAELYGDPMRVQQEIVKDLEEKRVRFVVLTRRSPTDVPPGPVRVLDDYLRANFQVEATFGEHVFARRKGTPALDTGNP